MFTPYLIQKYTSDKLTEIEKSSKIGLRLLGDFWRAIFEKSSKSGTQEKYYNDENKFQPRQEANQPLKIWPVVIDHAMSWVITQVLFILGLIVGLVMMMITMIRMLLLYKVLTHGLPPVTLPATLPVTRISPTTLPEPYPKLKRPTLHSLHAKPRQIV